MVQMDMPFFGSALGLVDADPIGRFVAGALIAILLNKSFSPRRRLVLPLRAGGQQIQRVMVGLKPVRFFLHLRLESLRLGI